MNENEILARKLEEAAKTLENEAATLRNNAKAVRGGRLHRANESITSICNLLTTINLQGIINAMINVQRG
jgi:hypothetical protein